MDDSQIVCRINGGGLMRMSRSRLIAEGETQPQISEWFTSGARYWLEVFDSDSLDAVIYGRRLARSIAWLMSSGSPQDLRSSTPDAEPVIWPSSWQVAMLE